MENEILAIGNALVNEKIDIKKIDWEEGKIYLTYQPGITVQIINNGIHIISKMETIFLYIDWEKEITPDTVNKSIMHVVRNM